MMIHEAVYKLYSHIVTIEEDEGNYICRDKDKNRISIDMDAVNATAAELRAEHDLKQKTHKTNKVSAYRKMQMTDAEILSLDQTLEEYL